MKSIFLPQYPLKYFWKIKIKVVSFTFGFGRLTISLHANNLNIWRINSFRSVLVHQMNHIFLLINNIH